MYFKPSRALLCCCGAVLAACFVFAPAPASAQLVFPWDEPAKPKPKPKPKPPAVQPQPGAQQSGTTQSGATPPEASALPAQTAQPSPSPASPAAPQGGQPTATTPAGAAPQATPGQKVDGGPQTSDQIEVAFWNSVKDSGKASEFKAYLKQFPKGKFAELAKLRISDAERKAQSPTKPEASEVATEAQDAMKEVQERLYNLNFDIRRFDGLIDSETDAAIKSWQRQFGYSATGLLTAEQLARLRRPTSPVAWGALAYTYLGVTVEVHTKPTRREAEAAALSACREKHGVACNVVAVMGADCVAISTRQSAKANGSREITQFFARERGRAATVNKAIKTCKRGTRNDVSCSLVGAVCATGAVTSDVLKPELPGKAPSSGVPTTQPRMPQPPKVPARKKPAVEQDA